MLETRSTSDDLYNLYHDQEKKRDILKIPQYVLTSVESKSLYQHIRNVLKHFDHDFDNTVVDTYAFGKVLSSDKLINVIYYYLIDETKDLEQTKKNITLYVLTQVEMIYKRNDHHIFKPQVYLEYIDRLINRILALKHH